MCCGVNALREIFPFALLPGHDIDASKPYGKSK